MERGCLSFKTGYFKHIAQSLKTVIARDDRQVSGQIGDIGCRLAAIMRALAPVGLVSCGQLDRLLIRSEVRLREDNILKSVLLNNAYYKLHTNFRHKTFWLQRFSHKERLGLKGSI